MPLRSMLTWLTSLPHSPSYHHDDRWRRMQLAIGGTLQELHESSLDSASSHSQMFVIYIDTNHPFLPPCILDCSSGNTGDREAIVESTAGRSVETRTERAASSEPCGAPRGARPVLRPSHEQRHMPDSCARAPAW